MVELTGTASRLVLYGPLVQFCVSKKTHKDRKVYLVDDGRIIPNVKERKGSA